MGGAMKSMCVYANIVIRKK